MDDYIFYKGKTKTVLHWLASQSSSRGNWASNGAFRSTREITACAKRLPDKHEVPLSVISALREAIGARRRVNQWYKELRVGGTDASASEGDGAHEAFITRLEETLHVLQSKRAGIQSKQSYSPAVSQEATPQNDQSYNRFAFLGSGEPSDQDTMEAEDVASATSVNEESNLAKAETEAFDDGSALEDDDLGEWIELNYYLCSLDSILDQSNKNWTEAANGTLPLCLAAWLSSTAFHEMGRRYRKLDYDTLVSRWQTHPMKQLEIRFKDVPGLHSETRRFMNLQGLSRHRNLLQVFRSLQDLENLPPVGRHVVPGEIIARPSQDDLDSAFRDEVTIYTMLGQMRQLLVSQRAIAAIESEHSPQPICEQLLPFFDKIVSDAEQPIDVQLVFGLEMLLSSYKAYTWPGAVLNRQSSRLLVLRFGLEAQKSMSDAVGCLQKRPGSLSTVNLRYLQNVLEGLKSYTAEVRFDLYHQAPWTAGCHMVEILTLAMFEGLRLCFDTGYLCALLHLYNALWRIDSGFRRIRLLDQLCEVFLDKLFLGAFPTENFRSHFRRATGSELTRKPSTEGGTGQMELSSPVPGLSKREIGSTRLSEFYDLHTLGYEPPAEFWHLAFEALPPWQPTTRRERDAARRRAHRSLLTVPLQKVKENVIREFVGPLPIARINYLTIFVFAADSMEKLCYSFTAVKEKKAQADSDLGSDIVDTLLGQIVDHLRDDGLRLLLPYWRPVNNGKNFFNGLDGDLCLDQYLWKSAV